MVDSLTKEQLRERAIGWDAAVKAITSHVTPYIRRKLMLDNPYREEHEDA